MRLIVLLFLFVFGCKEVSQQSAVNSSQSAVDSPQSAVNSTQSAVDSGQSAVSSSQSAGIEQQAASGEQQAANGHYEFSMEYLMGQFDPAQHPDFSSIALKYADREGMYMRTDAYTAFVNMFEAAMNEGIKFQIRSAARNFDYQKGIWERKWNGETKIENGKNASIAYPDPEQRARMILLYSSMPGTSRHHWGTDIDLNSFDNEWFTNGEGAKLYQWMQIHANEYGFCQPYTDKSGGRTGYEEERWHWTYMPISKILTHQASTQLKNDMIDGFLGAEVAPKVDMVNNYVLGINEECN